MAYEVLEGTSTSTARHSRSLIIPQELWDMVIDHLWRDIETLKALSLTCTTFVPRSLYYVHRRLEVRWGIFAQTVDPERYSSPQIARFVRDLTIKRLPDPRRYTGRKSPVHEDQARTAKMMWRFLSRFSNIGSLSLSLLAWPYGPKCSGILSALCYNVTNLVLRESTFMCIMDIKSFCSLLDLFPRLLDLEIVADYDGELPEAIRAPFHKIVRSSRPQPKLHLRHLKISAVTLLILRVIVQWLSRYSPNPSLNFTLEWYSLSACQGIPNLLEIVGASLTHLHIENIGYGAEKWTLPDAGIEYNTALQSITLGDLCRPKPMGPSATKAECLEFYAWVPNLLSQIASKHLKTVEFRFFPKHPSDLDRMYLEDINKVLSNPLLDGQVQVRIIIEGINERDHKEVADYIWHRLNSVSLSGALHIEFSVKPSGNERISKGKQKAVDIEMDEDEDSEALGSGLKGVGGLVWD